MVDFTALPVKPTDRWLQGLSTATKPTLPARDISTRLIEIDTGNRYLWSGLKWNLTHISGRPISPSNMFAVSKQYVMATQVYTVAAGASIFFGLLTHATLDTVLQVMDLHSAAGATEMHIFEGVTINAGTAQQPQDVDFQTNTTYAGTFKEGIDPVTGTTRLHTDLLGDTNKSVLAHSTSSASIRLKRNTQYAMEVKNNDTGGGSRLMNLEFVIGTVE